MNTRSAISAIGGFFDLIGSAIAVSSAVEAKRMPGAAHLRNLGIDPKHFRRIGR